MCIQYVSCIIAIYVTCVCNLLNKCLLCVSALEKCNFNKQEIKEFLNWTEKKRSIESLPVIYMITPTYSRWTQKADLTRLCNTLTHVPHLVWMVVEDSEGKTSLVTNLLSTCVCFYIDSLNILVYMHTHK